MNESDLQQDLEEDGAGRRKEERNINGRELLLTTFRIFTQPKVQ
jgi:hypothetical protein